MADDPRRVVERLHELMNARELTSGRELFAPDVRFTTATGRVLNLAGMAQLLGHTRQAFPDMQVSVERWVIDGDVVVTEEVMEGTHKGEFAGLSATGRKVRLPMCHVTKVVDGRIVERHAYHDSAGILRQLTSR